MGWKWWVVGVPGSVRPSEALAVLGLGCDVLLQ